MNYLNLAGHLPWPVVAAVLANVLASPYLAAFATRAPSWATGAVTALLSVAAGFFGTWAAQGDAFNAKAALAAALVAFIGAVVHHKALLSGTSVEARLHAAGFKKPPAPAGPAA